MAQLTKPLISAEHSNWICWLTGGKTSSVCEALWAAAESAPDTDITITLVAATGASFAFPVKPEFPTAGGGGIDAQTVSFTFTVTGGAVTETFS